MRKTQISLFVRSEPQQWSENRHNGSQSHKHHRQYQATGRLFRFVPQTISKRRHVLFCRF